MGALERIISHTAKRRPPPVEGDLFVVFANVGKSLGMFVIIHRKI